MLSQQLFHLQFKQRHFLLVLLLLLHQHLMRLLHVPFVTTTIIHHLLIPLKHLKVVIIAVYPRISAYHLSFAVFVASFGGHLLQVCHKASHIVDASLREKVRKFDEEGRSKVNCSFVMRVKYKKGILCIFELAESEVVSIENSQ